MDEFLSLSLADRLEALQAFAGAPAAFWKDLAATAAAAVEGRAGAVFVRSTSASPWQCIGISPQEPAGERQQALRMLPLAVATDCDNAGGRISEPVLSDPSLRVLAVWTTLPGGDGRLIVAAVRPAFPEENAEALLDRLATVAATAPVYQVQHVLKQARTDVGQFSNVLDLMALINGQEKFTSACMVLVNELATRLRADRASIGWQSKGYIRARTISHMERFEKNMDGVQSLESAMEEAWEQDAEIVCPAGVDDAVVSRDLARHCETQTAGNAVAVPLRHEGKAVAVLLLERKSSPFDENEVRWLRLCADQTAPRLWVLEARDVWFGARWARSLRRFAGSLLGYEHTGAKLLAIFGTLLALFLIFGSWPHRVNGSFELQSASSVILPAPFEGFLENISVDKGDVVEKGAELLRLDSRDLLIEKAAALGDLNRYMREAEKSRAEAALGDMRMAEAMAEQAQARLARVEDRMSRSVIHAPFAGAVVEGDLRERVGAPVRQGEVLFRLARWDALKVQATVEERDIDHVKPGALVKLIFASRPDLPTEARVTRVDPMSVTRDGGNLFVVHCEVVEDIEPWWRPGMSGTARIDVGRRTPIWLLTHRTLDYLRLRWGW